MMTVSRRDFTHFVLGLTGIVAVTLIYRLGVKTNATTVALSYLLVVLFVAAAARLWVGVGTSIMAMIAFNFFFLPPVGTFRIADPQNWVSLFAFLAVSLVASRLSAVARDQQREALNRRDELARLFDLSRDVLLTTDSEDAISVLARHIALRFQLGYVAICLPDGEDFRRYESGASGRYVITTDDLRRTLSQANQTIEFDARWRTYAGHEVVGSRGHTVRLVPLRLGSRAIGLLATAGRTIEPGTLDTLASVVAIAIERAHFLEERKQAELAQRGAELKSALLSSLAHDLRTPLTAIRVAASNLHASWLTELQRVEQSDIVLAEVERLTRLFQNILEMTRIDAGAIAPERQWVHPLEIIEAAQGHVEYTLRDHRLEVRNGSNGTVVNLDPRLTSAALAHLLENAAQYSPPGSAITVDHRLTGEGLLIAVEDNGDGIAGAELTRVFERFYRGGQSRRNISGTGMGLSITRGLLAAENGRVWAENRPEGGSRFSILIPAEVRQTTDQD
jgi:two-component system, OmpR family, sensor histidine kinase KdpD